MQILPGAIRISNRAFFLHIMSNKEPVPPKRFIIMQNISLQHTRKGSVSKLTLKVESAGGCGPRRI